MWYIRLHCKNYKIIDFRQYIHSSEGSAIELEKSYKNAYVIISFQMLVYAINKEVHIAST